MQLGRIFSQRFTPRNAPQVSQSDSETGSLRSHAAGGNVHSFGIILGPFPGLGVLILGPFPGLGVFYMTVSRYLIGESPLMPVAMACPPARPGLHAIFVRAELDGRGVVLFLEGGIFLPAI